MEQQTKAGMPSNKLGITFGLVTGLAMVVYSFILKFIHAPERSPMNFVVYILFLLGVLYFIYNYSKDDSHANGFADLFKAGFRMVSIVTIIMLLTTLAMLYLDPSIKQNGLQGHLEDLQQLKKSPAEIVTEMKAAKENFVMSNVMSVLYLHIFLGVCFSAVGATFFKKDKA